MKKYDMTGIRPGGDLHKRSDRTFSRLESDIYQPEYIRKQESNTDWPGDWGGRTLLAVCLLSLSTDRDSAYADELFELLYSLRNERGYLGKIEEQIVFDEQQFSGHNWLLRGLLSYYKWRGDPRALSFADDIVRNLYLPATGYYRVYPVNPKEHVFAGEKSGTVTGNVVNHWRTSSDTGCAFMCLDGVADYYVQTHDKAVEQLLREMIEVFMTIDFVELSMQTHASLSATRGILKLYREIQEPEYLAFAEKLFALYLDHGATINYANYNWFCRPEWTEPCAIIDSYILCFDLFCATGKNGYLQTANRIRYNALDFAQRLNGGFGCDVCVGPEELVLHADVDGNEICEAYWCCTMRGGEGMSALIANTYLQKDDAIIVAQYSDSTLKTDGIFVEQTTAFPYEGRVDIRLERYDDTVRRIGLYVPEYAKNINVTVNGAEKAVSVENGFVYLELENAAQHVQLHFDIDLKKEMCIGKMTRPGVYSFWHGDLMMGVETKEKLELTDLEVDSTGKGYRLRANGQYLTDLRGNIDIAPDCALLVKSIQVAFAQ